MTGSKDATDSSSPEKLSQRRALFQCSSGCEEYVDVPRQDCCAHCKSRKIFVTKSELLGLIEGSSIEAFNIDIDFLILLVSRPALVECSPITSNEDAALSMESDENVSDGSIQVVHSPPGRRSPSVSQQDVESETDSDVGQASAQITRTEGILDPSSQASEESLKLYEAEGLPLNKIRIAETMPGLVKNAKEQGPTLSRSPEEAINEDDTKDNTKATQEGNAAVAEGGRGLSPATRGERSDEGRAKLQEKEVSSEDSLLEDLQDQTDDDATEPVSTGNSSMEDSEEEADDNLRKKISKISTRSSPPRPRKKRTYGKRGTPRAVRNLRNHIAPGLTDLAPEPAVYSNITVSSKMERACLELEAALFRHYAENAPEYVDEMIESDSSCNPTECMAGEPERVEKGYYKVHLNSNFVTDNFGDSCLPHGTRVRTKTEKKAIAFFSTTVETLSNTHYDQDPSFLFVLKGKKTIMYAHPTWKKLYARFRSESHSSIFDGVNPHEEYCAGWECLTLTAGDGLMLPQNWLHSVKSSPGTVAISFQVESTGELKNPPEVNSAKRRAASPPLLLSQSPVPNKRIKSNESKDTPNVAIETSEGLPLSEDKPPQVAVRATSPVARLRPPQGKKPNRARRQIETIYRGIRKSSRAKLPCGNGNCHNTFPTGGLMWMLIRKDIKLKHKSLPDSCPLVPKKYPKHLICFDCQPQNGQEVLHTSQVLSDKDKQEFKDWMHYLYCPASKGDYTAQADQAKIF